jgi:hypothetical protein
MATERRPEPKPDPDPVRAQRIRADAKRPMAVNLAETIDLSHGLLRFAAAAAAARRRD